MSDDEDFEADELAAAGAIVRALALMALVWVPVFVLVLWHLHS